MEGILSAMGLSTKKMMGQAYETLFRKVGTASASFGPGSVTRSFDRWRLGFSVARESKVWQAVRDPHTKFRDGLSECNSRCCSVGMPCVCVLCIHQQFKFQRNQPLPKESPNEGAFVLET
jgi:hypothetical protein